MGGLQHVHVISVLLAMLGAAPASAIPPETLQSVVSVLPVWPGKAQGGGGAPPGTAPEGSGVAVGSDGLIATAWHVIAPAERVDVRLADGRVLPATIVGHDVASDIAVLRIDAALPELERAPRPTLAQPVCAIGNAYGLGLSVTCGVVSALNVSSAGFNAVEDFVQTDAAANPGSSGGALVDADGRLVGMVSAIFASGADTNIGVNFAVSTPLLMRVVEDLLDDGSVDYVIPGWRLVRPSRAQLAEAAGVRVAAVAAGGVAADAGVEAGDLILRVGTRRILRPRDVESALALMPSDASVDVVLARGGRERSITLVFREDEPTLDSDG